MKRSPRGLLAVALVLAAAAAGVQLAPGAGAQPLSPASGEDLRALYATPAEVVEGKRVAQSSCRGCHGMTGISATREVPHIAGQRAPYVYLELRNYKLGARGDNPMAGAVKLMSDDALLKAAAYYASLDRKSVV